MFDIFGFNETKKQKKRRILTENKRKGKTGEDIVAMNYRLRGYEVERTGKGHDLRVRQKDWTGRVVKSKVVEVKTGKARLSKLQKKTKKKKSNYKVERLNPYFY